MNSSVLDTSGWIEVLGVTERSELYESLFEGVTLLRVPSVCLYEAAKFLGQVSSEPVVEKALRFMQQFTVEAMDGAMAITAARMSRERRLPMADAIIYATAQKYGAELWTQDAHFKDLPGVRYFPKP